MRSMSVLCETFTTLAAQPVDKQILHLCQNGRASQVPANVLLAQFKQSVMDTNSVQYEILRNAVVERYSEAIVKKLEVIVNG